MAPWLRPGRKPGSDVLMRRIRTPAEPENDGDTKVALPR
jgi:hypothetical protein